MKDHWETVFRTKKPAEVSWYQPHLQKSLELIQRAGVSKEAEIIDVGGGASTLVDDLLADGFKHLTVLDLSAQALAQAKARLGEKADRVTWLEADITEAALPANRYDLWHDRAVFHFLAEETQRQKYVTLLKQALKPGGYVIIASFSLEGPPKCSGLDVRRYSPETMSSGLGGEFLLAETLKERHQTPSGATQDFIYCLFKFGGHNT